jgi:hypothetical protein
MNSVMLNLLPAIKGAPTTVLLALFLYGSPLRQCDIMRLTGASKTTVSSSLVCLHALGLVRKTEKIPGWVLTDQAEALLLQGFPGWCDPGGGAEQGDRTAKKASPGPAQTTTSQPPDQDDCQPEREKNHPVQAGEAPLGAENSPRVPVFVVNDLINRNKNRSTKTGGSKKRSRSKSRRNSRPKPVSSSTSQARSGQGEVDPTIRQAFSEAGIFLNPRTHRLANMPHLTPEYVRAHLARLKADGLESRSGLLITILESGAPAPALNAAGHLEDCRCETCRDLKYRLCWTCGRDPCICPDPRDWEKV